MRIKERIIEIINAAPQNRAGGGVFSPKRLMAAVAAVIMAAASGVTAWAAGDGHSTDHTCSKCGVSFEALVLAGNDFGGCYTYQVTYSVSDIPNLTNLGSEGYYESGNHAHLHIGMYNGGYLCQTCLETIINDYKASQNDPDPAEGSVTLHASVSGAYTLVIPATVELSKPSGGDGIGTYTGTIPVKIKGTLASGKTITVSVSNASITCEDGTNAAVNFTDIPKTEWSSSEVSGEGTTANYTVSTELNVPGEWNGTATFGCVVGNS